MPTEDADVTQRRTAKGAAHRTRLRIVIFERDNRATLQSDFDTEERESFLAFFARSPRRQAVMPLPFPEPKLSKRMLSCCLRKSAMKRLKLSSSSDSVVDTPLLPLR